MVSVPRMAVVGAGPGGLMLARILHLHGIDVPVFEGEASSSVRSQGWSLDMHAETGQYAIQCAALSDEFRRIARYQDQGTRIYNKYGTLLFADEDAADGDRPEIDRGQLRQMLLESLPADTVRWNHSLQGVEPQPDGSYDLVFRTGARERFDLVIGADGAWSRIRPLISEVRPLYSGVLFFELGFDDVDERYPGLAELVGHGIMFALGDSKALIAHRDANAHVGMYAAMRVPEDWAEMNGSGPAPPDALRIRLIAQFADWAPNLLEIVARSEGTIVPRPIHWLPVGHRWGTVKA